MSIISKPNTFTPNTTISSSEINDNFDTIYDNYNGGITSANLATDAVTTAKIADSNVTTAKIADANVTSAKLVESFFRGRMQSNTTNSAPTGLTVQFGWGFIPGNATSRITEVVTFPTPFASAPVVIVGYPTALAAVDPTAISDLTLPQGAGESIVASSSSITASNMNVYIHRSDAGSLASGTRYGYTWIALGTV